MVAVRKPSTIPGAASGRDGQVDGGRERLGVRHEDDAGLVQNCPAPRVSDPTQPAATSGAALGPRGRGHDDGVHAAQLAVEGDRVRRETARSNRARPPRTEPVNPAARIRRSVSAVFDASTPSTSANAPRARRRRPARPSPGGPWRGTGAGGRGGLDDDGAARGQGRDGVATRDAEGEGEIAGREDRTGPIGTTVRRRSGRGPMPQSGSAWSMRVGSSEPSRSPAANSRAGRPSASAPPPDGLGEVGLLTARATSSARAPSRARATASSASARSRGAAAGEGPGRGVRGGEDGLEVVGGGLVCCFLVRIHGHAILALTSGRRRAGCDGRLHTWSDARRTAGLGCETPLDWCRRRHGQSLPTEDEEDEDSGGPLRVPGARPVRRARRTRAGRQGRDHPRGGPGGRRGHGGGTVVVKAQVKTGGRGKAGGVKLAHSPAETPSAPARSWAWTSRATPSTR